MSLTRLSLSPNVETSVLSINAISFNYLIVQYNICTCENKLCDDSTVFTVKNIKNDCTYCSHKMYTH